MRQKKRLWATCVGLIGTLVILLSLPSFAQHIGTEHEPAHHPDRLQADPAKPLWEGSAEGIAYSEFNHHLAGFFVLLIGLSELRPAFGMATLSWAMLLLPGALFVMGIYLLIWSDHDAWPIGSHSLVETYSNGDWETLQHKLFGIVALFIGTIELLRRTGHLDHVFWRVPLPTFAIIGGLSLFLHSHGVHPAAHKIALHHAAIGIMAITAGSSKFLSEWKRRDVAMLLGSPKRATRSTWELAWAALVLLIGMQLLLYTE
ncbi:MAG: hypothetical protein ACREJU_09390 [Nitrospiraceae bacterium]